MLVARAFVLSVNSRAVLAVLAVGMSVAYALLVGAAVGGLQQADATLAPNLLHPREVLVSRGLAPFPAPVPDASSVALVHAPWEGLLLGTESPWPHGPAAFLKGPYAAGAPGPLEALGLRQEEWPADTPAPGDWWLVPPGTFARLHPGLSGMATLVVRDPGSSAAIGLEAMPAPAGGAFYTAGAAQVFSSVHLVVAATGIVVAMLSGGVLRLEVLARERDLAVLEALGGAAAARRVVVLRTLVLVGAGVAGGLAGGLVLAALAGRAIGIGALLVEAALAAEVGGVALGAGLVAGVLGGLRSLRAPLAARMVRGGFSIRPFPGPVRFLLATPRVFPSAFAAAFVMTAVAGVVLAAASLPVELFRSDQETVVVGQSAGNPFRGSADRFLGERATLLPGVLASSPETVAPVVVQGTPLVVRGVSWEGWKALSGDVALREGRWPSSPGEAAAGSRAAHVLGLQAGSGLVVPGAYRATARSLQVVGVFAGGGISGDEVLTDLDTAGDLAALPPSHVHLIRLRVAAGEGPFLLDEPLVVTNLSVVPAVPVPSTLAEAEVALVNLGGSDGTRQLVLRVDGQLAGSAVARVEARSNGTARIPFLVPDAPNFRVEVNPALDIATATAGVRVEAPETLGANASFTVTIRGPGGAPVAGAEVLLGEGPAPFTGVDGTAALRAPAPGAWLLRARSPEGLEGGRILYVVEPAWALSAHLVAERGLLAGPAPWNQSALRYGLTASLTNVGGAPFNGEVVATSGGVEVGSGELRLEPRRQATVAFDVVLPVGAREVQVAGLTVGVPAATAQSPDPTSSAQTIREILAAKRDAAREASESRTLSGRAFIEDVFAALEPSVALLLLASFLHAGAGVAVMVVREVRERAAVARLLATLGATPEQLAARGARDAAAGALPGLALGALAAWAVLAAAQPFAFPAAFGHTIVVGGMADLAPRVVGGLALVAAAAGAWAARSAPPEPPLQALPEPLAAVVGGRT